MLDFYCQSEVLSYLKISPKRFNRLIEKLKVGTKCGKYKIFTDKEIKQIEEFLGLETKRFV